MFITSPVPEPEAVTDAILRPDASTSCEGSERASGVLNRADRLALVGLPELGKMPRAKLGRATLADARTAMSFQKHLRSDGDWDDEIVQVAGVLQVVDVHQTWCGPCKAVASTLRRVAMDHGDKPIKFFTADAENIDALKKSVGGSEPRFQLWMNGKMKKEVKGVDAPTILGAIFKELGIKA